jgi:hypothetical protein
MMILLIAVAAFVAGIVVATVYRKICEEEDRAAVFYLRRLAAMWKARALILAMALEVLEDGNGRS